MDYQKKIKMLDALLAASDLPELRWERAALYELWGEALLKRDSIVAALEKFRASVADKERAIARTEGLNVSLQRVRLARNYLGIATLEEELGRVEQARAAAETALQTLAVLCASSPQIQALREDASCLIRRLLDRLSQR